MIISIVHVVSKGKKRDMFRKCHKMIFNLNTEFFLEPPRSPALSLSTLIKNEDLVEQTLSKKNQVKSFSFSFSVTFHPAISMS